MKRTSLALFLLLMASGTAAAIETARVDASSGVPRLVIDGQPVRARIFWGAPGTRPIEIGAAAREISFEFTPTEDEPGHGTLHFRFGQAPGQIVLDDIRVVPVDGQGEPVVASDFEDGQAGLARRWTFWPTGAANTVGTVAVEPGCGRGGSAGLKVSLRAPPDGAWPDFHLYHQPNLTLRKTTRYRVSLWVRAEPARELTIAFYRPGQSFVFLGGSGDIFAPQIRLAAGAGVNLVSFPLPMPWPKPGEAADWDPVDAACQRVLDANPQALLLPRLGMEPPPWWRTAHPEEMMIWDQGGQKHTGAVVASPRYRREAAARLTALIEHVEAKFGPHVAGYHPCGQNTGEWFYQETWGQALNGYAPADRSAWREWLTTRYASDAALQAAWRDPRATRAGAEVPTPAARRAAPAGVLRDPQTERPLIDFADFQQEAMADCVIELARAARQASRGKKLVVFFYGYVFEFAAIRNGPSTSGHYALRRVLDSPDIDVLCSPISYFDRGLGQSAPAMTAAESVTLAGKMWLMEDDTSTYLSTGDPPGSRERVATVEESRAQLVRNSAQCALRNFGTWWMDLTATGWFNDRRFWDDMARLAALDEPLLNQPRPFLPEVAAIIDETSMLRVAAGGQVVTVPGVYEVRRPLGRMGTPYGQYLLDDVTSGKVPAKMYVLLSPWCLALDQQQALLKATRGALKIWCYAPGYQEPANLDAMRELNGFSMKTLEGVRAQAKPTDAGRQMGITQGFGSDAPVRPLFAAADAKPEETLAVYPDGSAAVALRETSQGWSLFVGPPGLTSELLRAAARRAGVHLYTSTDCNVFANGPHIALHASQDGAIELDTGAPGTVRDLMNTKILGTGPKITLELKKGETRVLVTEAAAR